MNMKKHFRNMVARLGEYINSHNDKFAEDLYYALAAMSYK